MAEGKAKAELEPQPLFAEQFLGRRSGEDPDKIKKYLSEHTIATLCHEGEQHLWRGIGWASLAGASAVPLAYGSIETAIHAAEGDLHAAQHDLPVISGSFALVAVVGLVALKKAFDRIGAKTERAMFLARRDEKEAPQSNAQLTP